MIKITNLTHIYNGGAHDVKAIDDLSLEIKAGEHIAVLGHNGCGKSTLAKHLNALLLPTSGTVEIDDVDTANEDNLWTIRQMVGMVFQNPDNQLVATTVEEDVEMCIRDRASCLVSLNPAGKTQVREGGRCKW